MGKFLPPSGSLDWSTAPEVNVPPPRFEFRTLFSVLGYPVEGLPQRTSLMPKILPKWSFRSSRGAMPGLTTRIGFWPRTSVYPSPLGILRYQVSVAAAATSHPPGFDDGNTDHESSLIISISKTESVDSDHLQTQTDCHDETRATLDDDCTSEQDPVLSSDVNGTCNGDEDGAGLTLPSSSRVKRDLESPQQQLTFDLVRNSVVDQNKQDTQAAEEGIHHSSSGFFQSSADNAEAEEVHDLGEFNGSITTAAKDGDKRVASFNSTSDASTRRSSIWDGGDGENESEGDDDSDLTDLSSLEHETDVEEKFEKLKEMNLSSELPSSLELPSSRVESSSPCPLHIQGTPISIRHPLKRRRTSHPAPLCLQAENPHLQASRQQLEVNHRHFEDGYRRLKQENGHLQTWNSHLDEENVHLRKENIQLSQNQAALSKWNEKLTKTLDSTQDVLDKLSEGLEDQKSNLRSVHRDNIKLKGDVWLAEHRLEKTKDELSTATSLLSSTRSEVTTVQSTLQTTRDDLKRTTLALTLSNDKLRTNNVQLNSLRARARFLERWVDSLYAEKIMLQEEKTEMVKGKLKMEEDRNERNRALKELQESYERLEKVVNGLCEKYGRDDGMVEVELERAMIGIRG